MSSTTLRRYAGRTLIAALTTSFAVAALAAPSQAEEDYGRVSGRVVHANGTPYNSANLELIGAVFGSSDYSTDRDGRFDVPVLEGGMKLHVWEDNGGFADVWHGGTSRDDAPFLAPTPGQTTDLGNITLRADIKIEDGHGPRVLGSAALGTTVRAQKADWRPYAVTRRHQWYYVKNGRRVRLPNATHYYYKITSPTLIGRNLQFLETATFPGATPVSAWASSVRVVRASSLTASVSSPSSGKVKVNIGLKITGISKPSAKVRVRYASSYTATLPVSQWPYKKVSVKKGKGSVTISGFMPTSTAKIRVELPSTSTHASDTVSKSVKVKR